MWRFISLHYNTFEIYSMHPVDREKFKAGELSEKEYLKRRIKVRFMNGIFETDDRKVMEALVKHPHYGKNGLFVLDAEVGLSELDTIDKYGADKPLYDKLSSMHLNTLKSFAKDKGIATWGEMRKMSKEELINLMIRKKGLLGEYANVTE